MHRMGNFDRSGNNRCASCIKGLKWIPVLFILALVAWSYYAYVVELCIKSVDSVFVKVIFLLFYHIIGFLFLWSYWKTTCTPIGTVPPKWRLPQSEIDKLIQAETIDQLKVILEYYARDLPVSNRTSNGAVRFCDKCKIIKPDRAHHCSVCGCCVLKMDHHCPWVNNCVNFTNYKYFVLFLGYALLYCIYVAITSLENFIKFWQNELNITGMGRFHILFLFFVAVMFAISLVSLFGYHIYLVLYNRTTLEAFRAPIFRGNGPDKNGYNLGKTANFQEVFGDDWKLWFLPIFTSKGDGVIYRMQSKYQQSTYESMGDTPTRLDEPQSTDTFLNNTTNSINHHNNINNIINNTNNSNNSSTIINSISNTNQNLSISNNNLNINNIVNANNDITITNNSAAVANANNIIFSNSSNDYNRKSPSPQLSPITTTTTTTPVNPNLNNTQLSGIINSNATNLMQPTTTPTIKNTTTVIDIENVAQNSSLPNQNTNNLLSNSASKDLNNFDSSASVVNV
ncbi:palmitoyltransferase ZDHHC20-B isoform X2 [Condylostylus longicornis]|uniref:palmitoyltransferase ZDHHC20-B isoform X2 n=1 Tax=Condylostylus longicornis TaxID=2530218 RepID=UPI00244E2AC0|nr:palmitoyltransferase ZDHHC20-B isoform X2 [Condylostylus longicornis]